ncbi:Hypothetical predicted protein [Prunus dulcis]|uniref:Uncharacterized protein n=1 Tax=Prunus dulcis TaxID=3755 RepID=A0A5E4F866_PRUDU|nr:Hypothetical predicted protein [Prunus dulcis]
MWLGRGRKMGRAVVGPDGTGHDRRGWAGECSGASQLKGGQPLVQELVRRGRGLEDATGLGVRNLVGTLKLKIRAAQVCGRMELGGLESDQNCGWRLRPHCVLSAAGSFVWA